MPPAYPDAPTPEHLIEAIKPLPPTARVLARLQHLLSDPNSGLDDIAALLKLDAPLVTRVIHVSNSIVFRRGEPTATIEEAINRIGFREIYRLVAVIAAQAFSSGPLPAYGMSAEAVWEDSVATALAAELISNHINEDGSVAYTVGLLRAIGRRPINAYLQQKQATLLLANHSFPEDYTTSEVSMLGYNQAEIAARLLKRWDFTPGIVEPVRHQCDPLKAPQAYDRMTCLLFAARMLTARFLTHEEIPESLEEAEILADLRLDRIELLSLLGQLETAMERARQITGAMNSRK